MLEMERYREVLAKEISKIRIQRIDLNIDAEKLAELRCYQDLEQIKEIIEDDTLEDAACFEKIERIVCAFEEMGIAGGSRHDFG